MILKYRSEIDGLRAIAVFAVILYHANFFINGHEVFQGGFIGVDIFFVISGYLITSLIYKESLNNIFSFKVFYIRRIRRIIPILLIVILCCILIAYLFLLPSSLDDFILSIWSTLVFSSNFYFFHTGLVYGGPDASLKPLLHTWSLSVEEQFYIVFPIFFTLIFRLAQSRILKIICFIFFLSLVSTLLISKYLPNYNFYFLNVRIWELLAGSILSILGISLPKFKKPSYTKNLPLLGFILIILSIFLLNDQMSLPSIFTLPSVIGVCLIIFFSNNKDKISNILSLKIIVFFGLISYSLYLWHYPIFAFYSYIFFSEESGLIKVLLILLSILISVISYQYIEKPFRNKSIVSNKSLLIYMISFLSMIIVLSSFIFYKGKGVQENIYTEEGTDYGVVNVDSSFYMNKRSNLIREIKDQNNKVYPFTKFKKNILVVGNSHAEDFFLMLKLNLNFNQKFNIHFVGIKYLENNLKKYISNSTNDISKYFTDSDIIIFSNRWSKNDVKNLDNILKNLTKINKKIILTNQNINLPSTGRRDVTLLDKFIIDNQTFPNKKEIDYLERQYFDFVMNDRKRNRFNKKLKIISDKYSLELFDKSMYQCDYKDRTCEIFTPSKKKINYNDNHHTLSGIRYLGKIIYESDWLNLN